jgi:hypothetical protein
MGVLHAHATAGGGARPAVGLEADRGRQPGLSPLFWSHVNVYGRFRLDIDTRLDLTAA